MKSEFILVVGFCLTINQIGGSLISKVRDQHVNVGSSFAGKGAQGAASVGIWSPTLPGVLQDVLVSIDEKLRSLDTFSHTLKLARLDFSMEQVVRRLENIETKLSRMETKFDLRLEKVEEVVVGKDLKEEFSNDQMIRQMDNLNDKFNNKIAFIDAKIEMRLERMFGKLDLLEREVQVSGDDILEKLSKKEEKQDQFESRLNGKLSDLASKSWHLDSLKIVLRDEVTNNVVNKLTTWMVEKIVNNTKSNQPELGNFRTETEASTRVLKSQSSRILESLEYLKDNCQELNYSSDNRLRSMLKDYDFVQANTQTKERFENMTAALQRSLRLNEARFKELDSDVEVYSRKVVNGIQELRKSSDQHNGYMFDVFKEGNRTRQIIRHEFDELHEQIKPLSTMEPRLADVGETLNKKLYELGAKVDKKFDTLLIAQNTFISSCGRIQEDESQVYEALGQVVREMRNRSQVDMERISSNMRNHSENLSKSLDAVLMAILTSSNETAHRIVDLILSTRSDLVPSANCECQESNDIAQVNFNNLRSKALGEPEDPKGDQRTNREMAPDAIVRTIIYEKDLEMTTVEPNSMDNDEFDEFADMKPSTKNSGGAIMDYDYPMQEADYVDT